MSADFLANLALRAIEQNHRAVDDVRPRVASLFEASFAVSEQQANRPAMAEVEADAIVAGPGVERPVAATVRRQAPSTTPAQSAQALENPDLRLASVVDAARGPQRNSSGFPPKASATSYFGSVANPAAERAVGETGDFSIRPLVVKVAGVSGSPPGTPVLSPAQAQSNGENKGDEWQPPTLAARPSEPRLSATLRTEDRTQSTASVAPEPVIQVTIGRIEVRATQTSPAPRKAGPSAQPTTLDEYQKQRSQRGGGR